jgi:hypothetical protein
MSTTPTVNGQVIGQAHYATRAVLERVLARTGTIRASVSEITARLYADLPADDLAAAGRVLAVVTERANAELAVA